MTSVSNSETLLDSLENLPQELKQNFAMIRDRNHKCDTLMRLIDEKSDRYLATVKPDSDSEVPDGILKMYDKLKKHGELNVTLATKTYELVDRYIQRLDVDLASFEEQIQGCQPRASDSNSSRPKKKSSSANRKSRKTAEETDVYAKQIKSPVAVEAAIRQLINPAQPVSTDGLDMPVDPNEPTYCLCNQVSYGDMVGCDNADCAVEWFHFACVGLTSNPRGKWYCPRCVKDKKK